LPNVNKIGGIFFEDFFHGIKDRKKIKSSLMSNLGNGDAGECAVGMQVDAL